MNRKIGLLMAVVLALTLSACATKQKPEPVAEDTSNQQPADYNNRYGTGMSDADLAALGINGDPLNITTVYFEYNSSSVDERSRVIAAAHARELTRRGGAPVSLHGHADERGTRDYNLALGERRSQEVASLMNSSGTGNSTLQAVSHGEESPADSAHNEAAWQKNRRVEISY